MHDFLLWGWEGGGGWVGSCLEIVIAVSCFWLKLIVFAVVCVVSRTGFSFFGCDSGTSVSNGTGGQ